MNARGLALAALTLVLLSACATQAPEPVEDAAEDAVDGSIMITVDGFVGMLSGIDLEVGQACNGITLQSSTPPDSSFAAKNQSGEVVATGEWNSRMTAVAESGKLGVCEFSASFDIPGETTFVQIESGAFDQTFPVDEFTSGAEIRLYYNE